MNEKLQKICGNVVSSVETANNEVTIKFYDGSVLVLEASGEDSCLIAKLSVKENYIGTVDY